MAVATIAVLWVTAGGGRAEAGRLRTGDALDCSGTPVALSAKASDDVRIVTISAVPEARDILMAAQIAGGREVTFSIRQRDRRAPAAIDVRLGGIRQLEFPAKLSDDLIYKDIRKTTVIDDPRSAIRELWRIDEATVIAADLAYEVKEWRTSGMDEMGRLPADLASTLAGYDVVGTYLDTYTGFKAVAFERRDAEAGRAHRIYAIAGTQVFVNTDFRDWAAGLTMARAHMVSTAALRMIADAAAYATAGEHGGEVFITGQSQGAVTAQGVGFLLQEYLDAGPHARTHHLVHVVSWGAVGGLQPIVTMIERQRNGLGRDFPLALERHWAATRPEHAEAMAVWSRLARVWSRLDEDVIKRHVRAVADEMRVVGYFYEIDPFARAGTFLGTSLVLPTAFVLPADCEQLVTELMFRTRAGKLGITLESHFLKGYQRAVERGALAVARPAETGKWDWVIDLLPLGDVIGKVWLSELYRDTVLSTDANWRTCKAAGSWRTDRNPSCRRSYWPGCSRDPVSTGGEADKAAPGARWCLVDPPREANDEALVALPTR